MAHAYLKIPSKGNRSEDSIGPCEGVDTKEGPSEVMVAVHTKVSKAGLRGQSERFSFTRR